MPESVKPAAIVLLSSGLDSAFNLYRAHAEFKVLLALTFDYGQKAAKREKVAAAQLCQSLGVPHQIMDLPWFALFSQKTSLISGQGIPVGEKVQIENLERSQATAKSVWVPNRNAILLNIAAGFAEGLGADYVIPGFNAEEARTFPDNSAPFLQSLEVCWSYSTATRVRTQCFSIDKDKKEIVAEGVRIGLPFAKLWPCYLDGETWCGQCESCQRFSRALGANGLSFELLRGVR